jgi:hypothetical protein
MTDVAKILHLLVVLLVALVTNSLVRRNVADQRKTCQRNINQRSVLLGVLARLESHALSTVNPSLEVNLVVSHAMRTLMTARRKMSLINCVYFERNPVTVVCGAYECSLCSKTLVSLVLY